MEEEEVTSEVAAAVTDEEVCVVVGDVDGREPGGVTRGLPGTLVFPMISQGWFTSINTDRPSIKSCLELATTRLLSWLPLRANTLVVSTMFVMMDSTLVPFANGQNLKRDPTLSPIGDISLRRILPRSFSPMNRPIVSSSRIISTYGSDMLQYLILGRAMLPSVSLMT